MRLFDNRSEKLFKDGNITHEAKLGKKAVKQSTLAFFLMVTSIVLITLCFISFYCAVQQSGRQGRSR